MDQPRWSDDDALLLDLRAALEHEAALAAGLDAVRGAPRWRRPGHELAVLVHDSSVDDSFLHDGAGHRTEATAVRRLVFARDDVTVELDARPGRVDGRLVPAGPAEVELESTAGTLARVIADDGGRFSVPMGPGADVVVRVACTTAARALVTEWVRLSR